MPNRCASREMICLRAGLSSLPTSSISVCREKLTKDWVKVAQKKSSNTTGSETWTGKLFLRKELRLHTSHAWAQTTLTKFVFNPIITCMNKIQIHSNKTRYCFKGLRSRLCSVSMSTSLSERDSRYHRHKSSQSWRDKSEKYNPIHKGKTNAT